MIRHLCESAVGTILLERHDAHIRAAHEAVDVRDARHKARGTQ